ncbi:MAG: zinc transport system substrate-binding protein [Acidimicrobiaceae bacterium]|nr:zinc transport system substrate-binding protein [Acidimicrobiaceae bacterium]
MTRRPVCRRLVVAAVAAAVPVLVLGAGCGSDGAGSSRPAKDGRPTVVAGFFALADVVRAVAGPGVRVVDLTPPGVEPHDLELSTRQVDEVQDADAVVIMARAFQPAVQRAANRAKGKVVRVAIPDADPHIWLDPVRMQDVAQQVAAAMPGGHADASGFVARLQELDRAYRDGLRDCDRRTIVTAHAAFGFLAKRYGLEQEAITGLSPEAEPDPKRLAQVADIVRRTGTTTVFSEELVSPKVAKALAREAGVKVDVLNPLESGRPGTYLTAMGENLRRLRAALGCR